MRLWMMGTGPFAVPTFRSLIDSRHEVLGLITQPVRESKPGRTSLSPMRQLALESGLPIFDPERINTDAGVQLLQSQTADLLVVCDYGQILKPKTLATTRLGGIN